MRGHFECSHSPIPIPIPNAQKEKSIVDGKANEYDGELIAVKKSIDSMMREYDVLNKRLAQLIDAAGGTEKSPHELRVRKSNDRFGEQ